MPQTQINESETNLCRFSSQKKSRYSSMRLFSPSFHRVAHIKFAPAEMAQRPPSAFKIARKLILHVAGAVARAQRLSFRVKTLTEWEVGRQITAIQLMVVFQKVTVQLFSHRKTLAHDIASVHSFLSARSASLYDAGVAGRLYMASIAQRWRSSISSSSSSFLAFRSKNNSILKQEGHFKGFHFKWQIASKTPTFNKLYYSISLLGKGNTFFRGDINQNSSWCMAANSLQYITTQEKNKNKPTTP